VYLLGCNPRNIVTPSEVNNGPTGMKTENGVTASLNSIHDRSYLRSAT